MKGARRVNMYLYCDGLLTWTILSLGLLNYDWPGLSFEMNLDLDLMWWLLFFFLFFFYHFVSSLFLCVLKWNANFINASSVMPMASCMLFGFDHAIHYPLHVRKYFFWILFLHFSLLLFVLRMWVWWGGRETFA